MFCRVWWTFMTLFCCGSNQNYIQFLYHFLFIWKLSRGWISKVSYYFEHTHPSNSRSWLVSGPKRKRSWQRDRVYNFRLSVLAKESPKESKESTNEKKERWTKKKFEWVRKLKQLKKLKKLKTQLLNKHWFICVFNFSMIFDDFWMIELLISAMFYKQKRGLKMYNKTDVAYKTLLKSRFSSSKSHQQSLNSWKHI